MPRVTPGVGTLKPVVRNSCGRFDASSGIEVPMTTPSRRDFLRTAAAGFGAASARGQAPKADNPVKVPARAVTTGPKHHFFGYYDKTPWDKTGRYLLAHEVGFAARDPNPGEPLTVGMVDLKDGTK